MICQVCGGSGWIAKGVQALRYYPPTKEFPNGLTTEHREIGMCGTCKGHGELAVPESLAKCYQCEKPLRKCRCK